MIRFVKVLEARRRVRAGFYENGVPIQKTLDELRRREGIYDNDNLPPVAPNMVGPAIVVAACMGIVLCLVLLAWWAQ